MQEVPAASPSSPGQALPLLSQVLVRCVNMEYPELEGDIRGCP